MLRVGHAVVGLALMLAACGPSRSQVASSDAGALADAGTTTLQRSPDGLGFCCPIESPSCDCFGNGGFVESDDPAKCPSICDLGPAGATIDTDAHGCEVFWGPDSCLRSEP